MPLGILLIWPAFHLMYGVTEYRSRQININRRYAGRLLIIISVFLVGHPIGFENGFFYWLFALVATGLCFVQIRIWHPNIVIGVTLASSIAFIILTLHSNFNLDFNVSSTER